MRSVIYLYSTKEEKKNIEGMLNSTFTESSPPKTVSEITGTIPAELRTKNIDDFITGEVDYLVMHYKLTEGVKLFCEITPINLFFSESIPEDWVKRIENRASNFQKQTHGSFSKIYCNR